ncbi:MAG: FAD binding domain-containing protein [Candidatus Wallbacteria bacterium]|nr:FAD binding domain-containing protein [Candidatus Wallbacteria bacterium]
MKPFKLLTPESLTQALAMFWGSEGKAAALGGGTELLNLIRTSLSDPGVIIDLKSLKRLRGVRSSRSGVAIGATTQLSELSPQCRPLQPFAALTQAAAAVGTPQIRNRATLGGNLCQRPRCLYLRSGFDCWKSGGTQCPARHGESSGLAILGAERTSCLAVHPSDPAVALSVFDTRVKLVSASGSRLVPLAQFLAPHESDAGRDTVLRSDELVTEVRIASPRPGTRSAYVKVADRAAFSFALASAAAACVMDRGMLRHVRLALGGVAGAPWRARVAEEALQGRKLTPARLESAARAELAAARHLERNGYKVDLAIGALQEAVERAVGGRL